MNLYLKYRPKTIDELDLSSVRDSLGRVIKSGKTGHAYLFTGPRGAGKTSAARILARVVNCESNDKGLGEPCNKCSACESILSGSAMDVIEIDAASNRGIDDVRELKEKIGLAPSVLRKKVYIIDEVHMMTTEAFNALLKTLEEPPDHALFVLCTTEAHKVPETIASRCSRVLFTKATGEEMIRSFSRVVKGEKADVSEEALGLLSQSVDGSFRDGIKILDQVLSSGGEVGLDQVQEVLSGASGYSVLSWAEAMRSRDLEESLEAFRSGVKEGVGLVYALVALMRVMRDYVVDKGESELVELVYMVDETTVKLGESPVPEILVEMMIVKWCRSENSENSAKPDDSEGQVEGKGREKKVIEKQEKGEVNPPKEDQPVAGKKPKKEVVRKVSEYKGSARELWRELVKSLNGESGSFSLGALLAKASPGVIQGDLLTIKVEYGFHRDQIMQEKHRANIERLITEAVGQPMRIVCEVGKSDLPMKEELQVEKNVDTMAGSTPEADASMDEAIEIFS